MKNLGRNILNGILLTFICALLGIIGIVVLISIGAMLLEVWPFTLAIILFGVIIGVVASYKDIKLEL